MLLSLFGLHSLDYIAFRQEYILSVIGVKTHLRGICRHSIAAKCTPVKRYTIVCIDTYCTSDCGAETSSPTLFTIFLGINILSPKSSSLLSP